MQQFRFNTPQRSTINRTNFEAEPSGRYQPQSHQSNRYDSIIDYKTKAFELMQTVTDLEIKGKEYNRTIFYLQRELEIIHKNLEQFLTDFKLTSLAEVKSNYLLLSEKVAELTKEKQQPLIRQQKITQQYEKILAEYKLIISTQEEKMAKYLQKWKLKEVSLNQQYSDLQQENKILIQQIEEAKEKNQKDKDNLFKGHQEKVQKLETENDQLKQRIDKLISQIEELKHQITLGKKGEEEKEKQNSKKLLEQNFQMKQDLDMLKSEFKQLLIEKQSIEEKHDKLKKKYKHEIEHFEMIEKEVEQKLIEVEKEITFYKEERQANLSLIQKLQYENHLLQENPLKQLEQEFSFGGYFNVETQTDFPQLSTEVAMNAECYQISIKSLLEENSRLKKTLILLEKMKKGDEMAPEAQLQLRLLKGLSDASLSRSKNFERENKIDKSRQNYKFQNTEENSEIFQEDKDQNPIVHSF